MPSSNGNAPRHSPPEERRRIATSFKCSPDERALLEALRDALGVETLSDAVRWALWEPASMERISAVVTGQSSPS